MDAREIRARVWAPCLAVLLAAACGGGSTSDDTAVGAANQPPVPLIASPAEGSTFKAGDTIAFSGSATDREDGAIAASGLAWWAMLHHDDHTHPFVPETPGASGSALIPTRGETSDNIFYRFHLRATDSRGVAVEVTRDLRPRKSQLTLATQPAGLALTLDGQPVTAPKVLTGVVGIERDLGAADQNFNGRHYRFDRWSDGMAATHTISTPAANTTYTATFTDLGPIDNHAPSVTLSGPASGTAGVPIALSAVAADSDGSVAQVQFFDGTSAIAVDATSPYAASWTPTVAGTHVLTAVATDDLGATTTSNALNVSIAAGSGDVQPPMVSISAPANYTASLINTFTFSANASDNVGVAGVEFQVDGVTLGSEDTSAPYAVTVDTAAFSGGQHVLRARARDAAGNRSAWARVVVTFGFSLRLPPGFSKAEDWVSGFGVDATAFAQAPDGRIFVCEQSGRLRVIKNGALLPTAFHQFSVDSQGERGLIGVAFHPDFAHNGFVYVQYTSPSPSSHNRIARVVAAGDVSTGVETVLADFPGVGGAIIHNGGAVHFGLDGKLYVSVGDNSNGVNAPNLATVFGKLLRFNDDGSIPTDNPFYATQTGLARAIWAYGLRNPFTFAVQPGTGRIHINDVGQTTWEEINLGAPGANYGWPSSEGPDHVVAGITGPLFTYNHGALDPPGSGPGGFLRGTAIVGAAFYPSTGSFPAAFRNSYFFADYGHMWISRLDLANPTDAYGFSSVTSNPVDLLVGADGALYVLKRAGSIARISFP
ncbi:MAG TPA: PQQ-dependent sugar dehydrogenase [Albitalea sp.]|uniref:PQQ-dependent sugar dehydrogenase n=1 Tax=Piscinibacter sp. TaxID=1903157 RepID=UPI002ED0BA89